MEKHCQLNTGMSTTLAIHIKSHFPNKEIRIFIVQCGKHISNMPYPLPHSRFPD